MQVARIKLSGKDPKELDTVCNEIRDVAKKFGVDYRGPIPLPTKILRVVCLKTPCGVYTENNFLRQPQMGLDMVMQPMINLNLGSIRG